MTQHGVPRTPRHAEDLSGLVAELRAAGCVFAEDEARLLAEAATGPADLAPMVERRVAGEPLEYVLGWAAFCGLRILVEQGVFVPRRRTELLVSEAARLTGPGAVVVDVCCGSGALGVALTTALGHAELHAADIDPVAVRCARLNVEPLGGHVHHGDLFEPLPGTLRGRVDVLLVCAPYVPTDAIALMPPEARLHEPKVALDGGPDGLEVVRRVAAEAPDWLKAGGHLLAETSDDQAAAAEKAFRDSGLQPRVAACEDTGSTVVIGALPTWAPGHGVTGAGSP